MKRFLSVVFTLLFLKNSIGVYAQFGLVYGNQGYNYGESLCYTPHDSGYFLLGSSGWYSNGNTDFVLYKLDSAGNIKWVRNYGGLQVDKAISILSIGDSIFCLLGYSNDNAQSDYQIKQLNVNRQGDVLFESEFGASGWDILNKAKQSSTARLYLVGQTYFNAQNNGDGFILKTSLYADTLALVVFGDTAQESFNNLSINNNLVLASGYKTNRINGIRQPLLLKLDTNLNCLDTFLLNTAKDAEFYAAQQLFNKSILALGYIKNAVSTFTNKLLCLIDSSLNLVYIDSAGLNGDEYWKDFLQMPDSNLLMVGGTKVIGNGPYGFYDILFRYTDHHLNFLGGPTYGGVYEDTPNQIISLNDSVFACIGNTKNFGPALNHIFFLKFNIKNPLIAPERFVIGIKDYQDSSSHKLFPNPSRVCFKIVGIQDYGLLKIYDSNGRLLLNKTIKNDEEVNISELPTGLYLVSCTDSTGEQSSFKLVKE